MGHPVVHFEIGYRDQAKTERFFADLFGWHIQQTGYPFHSAVAADSGLVGRSPWTARTPPSRCRTRRHGPPHGRGRPQDTTSLATSG